MSRLTATSIRRFGIFNAMFLLLDQSKHEACAGVRMLHGLLGRGE